MLHHISTRIVLIVSLGVFGQSQVAEAGLIPWAYNAIFGYGPVFGGYHGAYYGGYYPAPAYYSAPMSYPAVPMTSYYGPYDYTAGYSYGCCPCDPCATGCSSCGTGCSPCGSGGCPGGDCGVGYSPQPSDSGTAEPTDATPKQTTPPTYRSEPEIQKDDFYPPARLEDDARPRTNSTIPNQSTPPRSTIPQNQPGGREGENDRVLPDPYRNPAPVEPSGNSPESGTSDFEEFLPSGVDAQPKPLELNVPVAASLKVSRQRIISQASYGIPTVVRVQVAPTVQTSETTSVVRN